MLAQNYGKNRGLPSSILVGKDHISTCFLPRHQFTLLVYFSGISIELILDGPPTIYFSSISVELFVSL